MRITCPCCGERNASEFIYKGDAAPTRPRPGDADAFFEYVYMRDNVAGPMAEYWQHAHGCQAWLIVKRHTVTHEIFDVQLAADAALSARKGQAR
jgi:sarcosine oxidase subunit delta